LSQITKRTKIKYEGSVLQIADAPISLKTR